MNHVRLYSGECNVSETLLRQGVLGLIGSHFDKSRKADNAHSCSLTHGDEAFFVDLGLICDAQRAIQSSE